jgi:hypothetical protein
LKAYAGTDPPSGSEIQLRKTCKTERAAQIEFGKLFERAGVLSFRGLDRRTVPGWFLLAMRRSGLFAGRVIRAATAIVWFYAGADRYRRAVHLDDLTPAAALTIMAELLSERGTGPADRSPTLTTLAGRRPS